MKKLPIPATEKRSRPLNFRVKPSIAEMLKQLAAVNGRSMAEVIEFLIDQAYQKAGGGKAKS